MKIEVVRRRTETVADELVAFWTRQGALDEAAARQRLADVVCVVRDPAGNIAGVNSVYADRLPLIANRRFWIYRRFAPDVGDDIETSMLNAAFEVLEQEAQTGNGGPVGLCILVTDPEMMRRHPEAVWPDTDMLYAGYTREGHQVRIRYFEEVSIL